MSSQRTSPFTAVAAESITINRFVDLAGTTANQLLKCSIADTTDKPFGVADNGGSSGDLISIITTGYEAMLEVDGSGTAIAAGDYLKPDASSTGKGIKAGTDKDAYGAIALEPSSADGDIIRVLVLNGFLAA